ncbi:MAG: zeta toxin family protein [Chitinophagales bacterium]
MSVKRMRVFAGPNGSGKTTIFKGILQEAKINLGIYVNADEIEIELRKGKAIPFSDFNLNIQESKIQNFFRQSSFSPMKRNEPDLWEKVRIVNNDFICVTYVDSYLAADLAEFIRQQLLANDISFTYETVMSHPGKIDFLQDARKNGFRVYLYYIATEDPEINISRVNVRVALDGHSVLPEVIRNRYFKSLANLREAVKQTNRAYIFDNSQNKAFLIAEINNGTDVAMNDAIEVPYWVAEYLLNPVS